jgi:Cd2+/Zn2+-exporting ATPase
VLNQAITLLVIACPCALVISTPVAIYAAIGNASVKGALIKGGKYIESMANLKAIAFRQNPNYHLWQSHRFRHFSTKRNHSRRTIGLYCRDRTSEHPVANNVAASRKKVLNHKAEAFKVLWEKALSQNVYCEENRVRRQT